MEDRYINIKEIAKIKGLSSTRSLRLEINKTESKYIAKEVKVNGGTSYEILFSSLEPEIQQKLRNAENKTTALVPLNNNKQAEFISDKTKMTANYRANIVVALQKLRKKYSTKKEADTVFLDLYNSGLYLPKAYNFIGSISIGTLHRWVRAFEKHESTECLQPKYKWSKQGEYNSILNDEMKNILLTLLLHPSKYNYGKAIKLTKEILIKRGYENLPSDISFKRFAEHFRKNNYAEWVLKREGMKAYHDKVEPYIERDISKIEVGDILVADGHVLNFQVINPFTGKPTRATLVGFLDWKSTALVGYEIMMSENTQCIASALRNAIINLGMIPKVVYQDNGRAFKAKYFQSCDFDEEGFNGVYANLGIKSVFAKPYNARAKVIERFFLEFQEEFKKLMPSYIGTSIENKPAWMKRGEKLHRDMHKKLTNNYIPTIQELIKYIDCYLDFHNSKPCPNAPQISIKQCLNSVQRHQIDKNILNDLMMKTEVRTINKHGITFLGLHYRSDSILGLRDSVYIRYSLFDLTKIHVYSTKGEFLCVARQVEKVHPMANHLGTVKDMEQFKQQIQKQQRQFKKAQKEFLKYFPKEQAEVIEIEPQERIMAEQPIIEKPKRERKLSPRELQMYRPIFNTDYEKYEWLMTNGCTNPEDRKWLTNYIRSDEYYNLYGD